MAVVETRTWTCDKCGAQETRAGEVGKIPYFIYNWLYLTVEGTMYGNNMQPHRPKVCALYCQDCAKIYWKVLATELLKEEK